MGGYGASSAFFVKTADGTDCATNAAFCAPFFPADAELQPWPVRLPARKPAGTLRVFVLGESAAMGTPDPSFGFARILEVMLRRAYPARRFEVVNAAVRGINSHLILPIARECAEHEPDLFVIYAGNNEMTGLYAPEPGELNLTAHPRLLRLVTRVKMTLHRADFSAADAVRWEALYAEGGAAETAGAREQAEDRYRAAAAIDDHFAELHFRLARCTARDPLAAYVAARDWDALPFRADARINDAVRAVARGFDGSALALADAERVFAESAAGAPGDALFYEHVHLRFAGDYLLARTLFPRVVAGLGFGASEAALASPAECQAALGLRGRLKSHPARAPAPALDPFFHGRRITSRSKSRSRKFPARLFRRPLSDWDTLDMDAAIAQLTGSPPFLDQLDHATRQARAARAVRERLRNFTPEAMRRAAEVCRAAVKMNPDDWQLHFICGRTLFAFGNFSEAVPHLETAVRAAPDFAQPRELLAECRRKTPR